MVNRSHLRVAVLFLLIAPGLLGAADGPRARISSPRLEFGNLDTAARARQTFELVNDSDRMLEIRSISTSSPALAVTLIESVPARGSAEIAVELDATGLEGSFTGAVTLITNDPSAAELRVDVDAFIGTQVEVLPKPLLALRAFRWEVAARERRVELLNRGTGPLEIKAVHGLDSERVDLEVTPVEAGQRYRLAARLRADGPAGTARSGLRVETNKGDVGIMVLTLLKDRVYTIPQSLSFEVDAAAIKSAPDSLSELAQSLQVYRLGSEDFRIELDSAPAFVTVTIHPASGPGVVQPIPDQGPTSIFDVTVTPVLEQLPPGSIAGRLRFSTNDPEQKLVDIPIVGSRQ
jgi:hypothetical protein